MRIRMLNVGAPTIERNVDVSTVEQNVGVSTIELNVAAPTKCTESVVRIDLIIQGTQLGATDGLKQIFGKC
jgi:hypothetical protein